jgi:signal transduction histidine kinase/CheY-like chemotaxis protein/HPt (histidine-containing phosphotransfer) domain-containing protein
MNAGYSSGWCEESFGLELTAAEVLCRACGDETCSFVMAPPQRIVQQIHAQFGDRVSAERLARVGPAAFFARKREEDLLRDRERLARDAAAASAAKNAFMTQMSHELRTPMNGIIGLSDLLGVSSLSAEQRETVQTLRHLASGLLGRIDALLDFANGDARVPEPEPEEFEVEELLSGALGLVAARAAKQRLDLEVFVDQRLPARLFGDRGRLHQVLANLLDNAVRVSACGALRLRAELQEHTAAGVIARFSVTDCGPGITEAQRARLFLPAGRSVGAAEHAGGGPGLGLAICRQVVELLGGAIDVRSGVGRGATFFFSVPLGDAPRSTAVPVSPQTKRTRVLVADDNPINCKVALSILERLGYDAEAAPDGRAALAALAASAFDVVLMDIEMPGMDGLETARRVRAGAAGEHHRGMPIIALTAHISVAEQRRCRAAGMNDFVSKPVHPERLRAKIERHLGRDGGSENPAAIGEGPEPDAPVLDVAELLARFDGDAALCKDLLRIFLRDAPGAVRALREARAAGDREALGREAHALRGAAAYVAARAVASCVQAVERCAAQGALDSVDPLLDTLDDALRSLGDAASRPLVPAG